MKKFAAFDIDGTVVRDALFFQIVDELIASGHLPADARIKLDEKAEAYRSRKHTEAFGEYALMMVEVLFGNMSKLSVENYRAAVDRVVDRTKNYTYVYTRELIKQLKTQGYFLIALSGSEMYAVEQFTRHFDFDLAVGEIYEARDGMLTGEVESVIHRKDVFLKKVVKDNGLTFEDSLAIGDSYSDAKMLALVEQAIAFNPERRLFDAAKQQGWKVVIERKNMVYELESTGNHYVLAN